MPRNYKVGDLIALGGADKRPSRLVVAVDENSVGFIPINWVSNGMPQVPESGIGTVVGNVMDFLPSQHQRLNQIEVD